MEEGKNKRARGESEDSEVNSPELKRVRVDSESEENSSELNEARDDLVVNSPEVERIRDDLLDILDDTETVTDPEPAIQDLDSFIKSFEEEILVLPQIVTDLTSESGESQPELGYLLEASDDELGLPPTTSSSSSGDGDKTEDVDFSVFPADAVALSEMLKFDDELPSYDSYGFGIGGDSDNGNNNINNSGGDYVTLGGLFDSGDFWEFPYKAESLPAV